MQRSAVEAFAGIGEPRLAAVPLSLVHQLIERQTRLACDERERAVLAEAEVARLRAELSQVKEAS